MAVNNDLDMRWDPAKPALLKNLRLSTDWQADFRVACSYNTWVSFLFNAKDPDDYSCIMIWYGTAATAPYPMTTVDGGVPTIVSWTTRTDANAAAVATLGNSLWVRVRCEGDCVTVRESQTQAGLDTASVCLTATSATVPMDGGFFGFLNNASDTIADDLVIKRKVGANGVTEYEEKFTTPKSNTTSIDKPTCDAAGSGFPLTAGGAG